MVGPVTGPRHPQPHSATGKRRGERPRDERGGPRDRRRREKPGGPGQKGSHRGTGVEESRDHSRPGGRERRPGGDGRPAHGPRAPHEARVRPQHGRGSPPVGERSRGGHAGQVGQAAPRHGARHEAAHTRARRQSRRDERRGLDDLFRQLQRGTSVDPHERILLETDPDGFSMRAMDLIAPIGKGQRCLIVSPPKAGKTTFLMDVARAVEKNHPEIAVYALLVDERPEEVTHFRRGVKAKVFAASSDLSAQEHVQRAEEAMGEILERVIGGEDILLLLDSITRLARAYNNVLEGTGRTLTGGLDAATMQAPRQVFGAARKIEEGGSLTILGTALVDTGSRMDEVIFQEFKGTGNTELVLSRELFERRIFPCIDIAKSGSRKEEKLVVPALLPKLHLLRRVLAGKKAEEAMTGLLSLLQKFPTNEALLQSI